MLLFFIYGILSVELFGHLCTTPDQESPYYERCKLLEDEVLLDSHASFVNIGMALTTLWRISTGDNWGAIMISCKLQKQYRHDHALEDAIVSYNKYLVEADADKKAHYLHEVRHSLPGCVDASEFLALGVDCGGQVCPGTCGTAIAPLFFCSFLCLSNFVLLNLVIAVLMEQLEETGDADSAMVSNNLSKRAFARIHWRWKVNAMIQRKRRGGAPNRMLRKKVNAKTAVEIPENLPVPAVTGIAHRTRILIDNVDNDSDVSHPDSDVGDNFISNVTKQRGEQGEVEKDTFAGSLIPEYLASASSAKDIRSNSGLSTIHSVVGDIDVSPGMEASLAFGEALDGADEGFPDADVNKRKLAVETPSPRSVSQAESLPSPKDETNPFD
jgi:hypothetical protein